MPDGKTPEASVAMLASVPASAPASAAINGAATPVTLKPLPQSRGCGPKGCDILVGALLIDLELGTLHDSATGRGWTRVDHGAANGLPFPDIDWTSPQAFNVGVGSMRWGTCLAFPHEGLGKSGTAQRWRSVVLVPAARPGVKVQAHRFTGYWATCEGLTTGSRPGEVVLPVVEAFTEGPSDAASEASSVPAWSLQEVRYLCKRNGCTRLPGVRRVAL